MKHNLKTWQAWAIFGGSMIIVFFLGICVSALMERRAEVASIYNNRKTPMQGIVARNDLFEDDFPREYETWTQTARTDFKSEFNGSEAVDVLAERPEMVILWAGYAFSKDYSSPRGHMHAIEDVQHTLRTGSPSVTGKEVQPATCWVCKSPDVPRMIQELGVAEFYKNKWSAMGHEIVNPVGCSDCHDSETMNLHISRPALIEAFERQGKDISKATPQEMRSLVCAQCHVEYYFKGDGKYLTFPWDKGLTMEDMEAYYDETKYYDYIHALSKAPILKAQHPDYEIAQMGIHGQRGVSCADCHMPYKSEGGIKFSDHHVQSPLNAIDRTCQVCHRETEETLRNNVYERQRKTNEIRNRLEQELAKAHLEAQFAWNKGVGEEQMQNVLQLIRQAQWRWDFGVASHGASFHAPQEIQRILSHGLDRAQQARLEIYKILALNGFTGEIPLPDISSKEKAQKYIGLDMEAERKAKKEFLETTVPEWLSKAKTAGKLAEI
ncbi:cytochrome C nitrite reductase [Porphyromonas macacae]|uniref:Cytochrome c-552 n=1 Tax=Porphyromonas macacae TaxID=28115 RepID=A0A0A2E4L0_9PORP|nr:ammonia-forming cytochrome c nitrite reductase [Porphyromonas macacae]KGN72355.1 cytochrome C nitrite reductase [Porphyromonas macacae]SUB88473.1 Cytochrome c-552 precursor [Porphyromonas macacae]